MTFTISLKDSAETDVTVSAGATELTAYFDVENVQTDYVIMFYEYVKDVSTNFDIDISIDTKDYSDYYQETVIDFSSAVIQPATITHSDAGNFKLVIPVTKDADNLRVVFTPDTMTGSDTLTVFFRENIVHGRGGR